MSTALTETATYDATVVVGDPGDNVTSAMLKGFAQPLANRAKFLKAASDDHESRIDALEDGAPTSFTRMIPLTVGADSQSGAGSPDWGLYYGGGGKQTWQDGSPTPTHRLAFAVNSVLPNGAVITQIRAGTSIGSGASTAMTMKAFRHVPDKSGTPGDGTTTQLGSTQNTGTTSGGHTLAIGGLSQAFNEATDVIEVELTSSDSSADRVYWLDVSFTHVNPAAQYFG